MAAALLASGMRSWGTRLRVCAQGSAHARTFSWMTEMYQGTRFLSWLCARTGLLGTGLIIRDSLVLKQLNSQALLLKGRRRPVEKQGGSQTIPC